MSGPRTIAVFADTKGASHYLAELAVQLGYTVTEKDGTTPSLRVEGQFLIVCGADQAEIGRLPLPAKVHILMAGIRSRLEKQSAGERTLTIGAYTLDTYNSILLDKAGAEIRLTEKETAILLCLHKAGGALVRRQALLDEVWGYAQNVETHTLETHIYRLRQKIEIDPSTPEILKTEEEGYSLTL